MTTESRSLRTKSAPRTPRVRRTNGEGFVSLDGMLTVTQWATMPDTKPRYELIDGRLVQKTLETNAHAWAAGELLFSLMSWSAKRGWQFFPAGTGVFVSLHCGYVPDVVGFEPGIALDPDESVGGTPFLVAEILSQSTAEHDRTNKMRDYARIGVQIYLIIDPDARTVEVFRRNGRRFGAPEKLSENDIWQPSELPELRLEVARLWM